MKRRTEEEWEALSSKYQASGLTQKEWCKANGINLHTFRDRQSRMKKCAIVAENKTSQPVKSRIKPKGIEWVTLTPAPAKTEPHTDRTAGSALTEGNEIQIKIGSFTITISKTFDKSTFTEVCKALMSLC